MNELSAKAKPVDKASRIRSLDLIRGFALLGILMVNIQSFAMPGAAYLNPSSFGDFTGFNYWIWFVTYVFFDLKFMALFSIMFGAGIVLMWQKASQHDSQSSIGYATGLHYRRMAWLLLIGLLHAYLMWYGDILVFYSLIGMIVYWLSGLRTRWLIAIGITMVSVAFVLFTAFGLSIEYWPEESIKAMNMEWQPSQETIDDELEAYRGSWLEQMPYRGAAALMMHLFLFPLWGFWRIGGLMCFGMALFKSGVLSAERSRMFYGVLGLASLAVGVSLNVYGLTQMKSSNFEPQTFFLQSNFNYWGSLLVALGYICLLMLWHKSGVLSWLQHSLRSVGQMALTNYMSQTLICTLVFYGHGLGLIGHLERTQQLGIVISIWIFQMVLSPIWLRYFRFGPCEWLWRSLTYWRLQPLRRVES